MLAIYICRRTRFTIVTCCILTFICANAHAQEGRKLVPSESPFEQWDQNNDGFLSKDEFPDRFPASLFRRIDTNGDGRLSRKEDDHFRALRGSGRDRAGSDQVRGSGNRNRLPEGATLVQNVIYEKLKERDLPLDLYRPKSGKPTPLVIWIHGGGWKSGSKAGGGPGLFQLLRRGYAVASVEYRLSGEAIFPAAVEDCKAAVSFLRLNALAMFATCDTK